MNRNEDNERNDDKPYNPLWPFLGKNKVEVSYKKGFSIALVLVIAIPIILFMLLLLYLEATAPK